MSLGSGGPFEPFEYVTPGTPAQQIRWWQAVLILSPFAAGVVFDLFWAKW